MKKAIDKSFRDLLFLLVIPLLYLYVGAVWIWYKIRGKEFPKVQ